MGVFEGASRRATDKVSTDESLELLATLAYEHALANPDVDILEVEKAIIVCRQLKIEATGGHRTLINPATLIDQAMLGGADDEIF